MPDVPLGAVVGVFKLLGIAPAVYDKLQQWKGNPSRKDKLRIVKYARRLNERRVFSAPFDREVGGACVGSLGEVKQFTDEALADVEHAGLQAVLGGILDSVRWFLDRWAGHPMSRRAWMMPFPDPDAEAFFQDLGELRGKVSRRATVAAGAIRASPTANAMNLLCCPRAMCLLF